MPETRVLAVAASGVTTVNARRVGGWLVVTVVALVAAHAVDEAAWRLLRDPRVYERDWGRLLRILGFLPTWALVAVALWRGAEDRTLGARRARLLLVSATAGGVAAEGLKLLVRRLRPDVEQFGYAFRAFSEELWSTRGLGFPSSHAFVAFAAAWALARLFPELRWLWVALAVGCGLTRVLAVGHYVSDVVAAAAFAWLLVAVLASRLLPPPVDQ